MSTAQEYFNFFLELLAKYINNETKDYDNIEKSSDDLHKSYILSNKSKISEASYWFHVGAAWGVTTIKILDDNEFVVDGTAKVADPFTDMVEDFTGLKIP